MKFSQAKIQGAYTIHLSSIKDERGAFSRLFCAEELKSIGLNKSVVQINRSLSKEKGTVRGLHFQYPPDCEIKMIQCLKGRAYDVAVDLRKGSNTYLQWYAVELSEDNDVVNYIPEGCAHGFQTREPNTELLYFHTSFYNKNNEGGVCFDDPQFSIPWPLPVSHVSTRDRQYPLIDSSFSGLNP